MSWPCFQPQCSAAWYATSAAAVAVAHAVVVAPDGFAVLCFLKLLILLLDLLSGWSV
jgi:hypothetical protein